MAFHRHVIKESVCLPSLSRIIHSDRPIPLTLSVFAISTVALITNLLLSFTEGFNFNY